MELKPRKITSMRPELVIFDCDGVLVDSEPIANRVLASLLTECGLPTTTAQAMEWFIGHAMPGVVHIAETRLGRALPADFLDQLQARSDIAFRRELRPVEGVVELLDDLTIPACVASNGPTAKMRASLGAVGLLPRFERKLFSAEQVPRPKPAADLFLYAAAAMKASPERCIVVEDGAFGVRAAVSAGMLALGFASRNHDAALREAGAEVFSSMTAIRQRILELLMPDSLADERRTGSTLRQASSS